MSFILDALKKSESDRQRQNSPDISDVPLGTRQSGTPRWLLPLIGLLLVNLTVLVIVLIKPSNVVEPSAVVPAEAAPTVIAQPAPARMQQVEESQAASRAATPAPLQAAPAPVAQQDIPVSKPLKRASIQAAAVITETRLTFNDLRVAGNLNLPDLNVDIHVYSEEPTDRFVFINMTQYRENATLTEGPLLREITPEGVLLEFAGATFLLPKD